jgi:hypothetical protein
MRSSRFRWRVQRLLLCLVAAALAAFPPGASAIIFVVILGELTLFEIEGIDFASYSTAGEASLLVKDTDTHHSGIVDLQGQSVSRPALTICIISRVDPRQKVRVDVAVAPLRGPAKGRLFALTARGSPDASVRVSDPSLVALEGPLTLGFRLQSETTDSRTGIRRSSFRLASVERRPELIGKWRGFLQIADDHDTIPIDLFVDTQVDRRFEGVVRIGKRETIPLTFPIDGNVATSGQAIFNGRSEDGKIVAHASLRTFSVANILDGSLKLGSAEHVNESGNFLLLSAAGEELAPYEFDNDYPGTVDFGGVPESRRILLQLHSILDAKGAPTTGVEGMAHIQRPGTDTWLDFQLLGKFDSSGEIVAIAAGEEGRLVLIGDGTPNEKPEHIAGMLRLEDDDDNRFEGAFEVTLGLLR